MDKPSPLLEFLFDQLTESKKTRVRQLLQHGCVSVGGQVTTQFNYALQSGDEVCIGTSKSRSEQCDLPILYEDQDLIAISKPIGLLSIATENIRGETALSIVNEHVNKRAGQKSNRSSYLKSVFIVHRLDRDVSGVMVFAKNEDTKNSLQKKWGEFTKEYSAVVEGRPAKSSDTLVSYLFENKILHMVSGPKKPGSKEAITHYEVIQSGQRYSMLLVRLGSGRKHQIRVQLAEIGCPIAGDKNYGSTANPLKRIALHAYRLKLLHPTTGLSLEIVSPIPDAFKHLVK